MASGNSAMVIETGAGWTRGLRNMLRGELGGWFGTHTWLVQILIWAGCVNLVYLMTALTARDVDLDATMIFCIFMGLAGPIGVTIVMQDAIIGEKRSGTAAWVLSKPVSREAFVLSKFVANSLGIALTMVLAQGVIAYLITGLIVGVWLPPLDFLAGLGALLVNIMFYLTLTLMLGVLLQHPAPVIGIPIAVLFGQNFLGSQLAQLSPALAALLPWTLAIPIEGTGSSYSVAMGLMTGQPTTLAAVLFAAAASVLFVTVAVVVFRKQEL